MWNRFEDEVMIDIQPRGEETRHIPDLSCECGPRESQSDTKKLMIIHRTFDGVATFEPVEAARRAA